MLQYSEDGLFNRDRFYSNKHSVKIYFEDNGKEYFYEELINRLFGEKNIFEVYGLNGKTTLISKYKIEKENKSIFVADGDFDLLIEKEMINDKKFIYLKKYNIESYLIDEDSIINMIWVKNKMSKTKIKNLLSFKNWYKTMLHELGEVFLLFATKKKYYEYSKVLCNNMIDESKGKIKEGFIESYREEAMALIENYDEKVIVMRERANNLYEDFSYIICGKIFIRCILSHIRQLGLKCIKNDEYNSYILQNINLSIFSDLKNKIELAIQ